MHLRICKYVNGRALTCLGLGDIKKIKPFQGLAVDQNTVNQAQAKIDSFSFSSLWFSGLASCLSLVVGQYTAFKVDIFS